MWLEFASWLPFADAFLPIGDIIYGVGLFCCAVIDIVGYVGVNNIANVGSEVYNSFNNLSGAGGGSPSGPSPDPNRGPFQSFRKALQQFTRTIGEGKDAHHVFPQKYIDYFKRAGININDPRFGAWVDKSIHRGFSYEYNQDWVEFIRANQNANIKDIYAFARMLALKYGFDIYF